MLAAIAYKNDVTQSKLAEWHDTGWRTIYSWLMRFDTDESLEQAVSDARRSGRKRKLSESQQEEFEQAVHESPEEVGTDAPAVASACPGVSRRYLRRRVFLSGLPAVAQRSWIELSKTSPYSRRFRGT